MSLFQHLAHRLSKLAVPAIPRPSVEPLEGRQLFTSATADIAIVDVRNPALPATLKVEAKPRGAVAVVLQNQGAAKYRGQVTVELQLSPDGQWNDVNPALKTVTKQIQNLRVNGKRVIQIKLPKIPASVADGTYHIAARITVEGEDSQATANNTGAGWKTTRTGTPGGSAPSLPPTPPANPNPPTNPPSNQNPPPAPQPEPTPTFVDLGVTPSIAETRLEGSTAAAITVTIRNHGTAAVDEKVSVDLWAGPNAGDTRGDVYLGSMSFDLDLAPGESATLSKNIIAPLEHTGVVYFRAEMYDVTLHDLGDTDRTNNQTATGPVEIWHRNVNLSGTWAFDADPSATSLAVQHGDVVRMRLNVTNSGTETFAGPVSASILALPTGLLLWATNADVTLAAGETKSVVVEFTVSPNLSPGDHPLQGRLLLKHNEGLNGRDNNYLPAGLSIVVV